MLTKLPQALHKEQMETGGHFLFVYTVCACEEGEMWCVCVCCVVYAVEEAFMVLPLVVQPLS